MNKSFKRFISTMLAACMAMSMVAGAAGTENEASEATSQEFIDFIQPLYEGQKDIYDAVNKSGETAINEFYEATNGFYLDGDWDSVHDYFTNNMEQMNYTEVQKSLTRSGDVSKTESKYFVRNIASTNLPGYTREVKYTLRGTIYYNPNTGLISSASSPIMTFISIDPGEDNNKYTILSANSTISSNKQSATFIQKMHIYQIYISSIDFGNVTDSFSIMPS